MTVSLPNYLSQNWVGCLRTGPFFVGGSLHLSTLEVTFAMIGFDSLNTRGCISVSPEPSHYQGGFLWK